MLSWLFALALSLFLNWTFKSNLLTCSYSNNIFWTFQSRSLLLSKLKNYKGIKGTQIYVAFLTISLRFLRFDHQMTVVFRTSANVTRNDLPTLSLFFQSV